MQEHKKKQEADEKEQEEEEEEEEEEGKEEQKEEEDIGKQNDYIEFYMCSHSCKINIINKHMNTKQVVKEHNSDIKENVFMYIYIFFLFFFNSSPEVPKQFKMK